MPGQKFVDAEIVDSDTGVVQSNVRKSSTAWKVPKVGSVQLTIKKKSPGVEKVLLNSNNSLEEFMVMGVSFWKLPVKLKEILHNPDVTAEPLSGLTNSAKNLCWVPFGGTWLRARSSFLS